MVVALLCASVAAGVPAKADHAGEWRSAAPMSTARNLHTATLLRDGRVLVAGGRTSVAGGAQETTAQAEVYDAVEDTWTPAGTMTSPRDHHAATRLRDGRVLVSGGYDTFGVPPLSSVNASYTNTVELWDPDTGSWTEAGRMAHARTFHSSTLLADGRVLVAGGDTGSANLAAELFDPQTGRWSSVAPMRTARGLHAAVLLRDGRVLIAGGYGLDGAPLKSAEVFDPATGKWSRAADLPSPHGHPLSARLGGGRVLIAGGMAQAGEPTAAAAIYRPRLDKWRRVPPMGAAREAGAAAVLPGGDVLVASGRVAAATPVVPDGSPTAEVFDLDTMRWHPVGKLEIARTNATATRLTDGRVLVVGGWNQDHMPEASAEIFARVGNSAA